MAEDTLLNIDPQKSQENQESQESQENQEQNQEQSQEQNQEQQQASWKDTLLPDDLRDLPLFDKYKSPQDAFRGFAEARKLIGKKGLIPPDNDATDEEKRAFIKSVYEKLGEELPEDPADYELPEIEDLPDDLPIEEELVEGFKDFAHEISLSKQKTAKIYEWYVKKIANLYNQQVEQTKKSAQEAATKLREKWGKAYESKVKAAKTFLDKFGTDGLKAKITSPTYGNDPDLIETLANAAEIMGEDSLAGTAKRVVLTPEEAKKKIFEIKSNPSHPFNDEFHPEHKMAEEEMESLYKQAYPELAQETA